MADDLKEGLLVEVGNSPENPESAIKASPRVNYGKLACPVLATAMAGLLWWLTGTEQLHPYTTQHWWVPIAITLVISSLVLIVAVIVAEPVDTETIKANDGDIDRVCDEGSKFFLYAPHCNGGIFECPDCSQHVCIYHGQKNNESQTGGHVCHPGMGIAASRVATPSQRLPLKSRRLSSLGTPELLHESRSRYMDRKLTRASKLMEASQSLANSKTCVLIILINMAILSGVPVVRVWRDTMKAGLDMSHFAVPANSQIPADVAVCPCVVIAGNIVMQPVLFTFASTAFVTLASFCFTLLTKIWKKELPEMWWAKLPDIWWESLQTPSRYILAPSFAIHLLHLFKLLVSPGMNYVGVYGNLLNNSFFAFMVQCLFSPGLTERAMSTEMWGDWDPHTCRFIINANSGSGFQVMIGVLSFLIFLPALFSHILYAAIKWFWLYYLMEGCVVIVLCLFFPTTNGKIAIAMRDLRRMAMRSEGTAIDWQRRVATGIFFAIFLVFFPFSEVTAHLADRVGLGFPAIRPSMLARCVSMNLFCCLKALELQFLFDLELLSQNGIPYMECVTLAYEARHTQCYSCVLHGSFHKSELAMEQIIQLFTTLF